MFHIPFVLNPSNVIQQVIKLSYNFCALVHFRSLIFPLFIRFLTYLVTLTLFPLLFKCSLHQKMFHINVDFAYIYASFYVTVFI